MNSPSNQPGSGEGKSDRAAHSPERSTSFGRDLRVMAVFTALAVAACAEPAEPPKPKDEPEPTSVEKFFRSSKSSVGQDIAEAWDGSATEAQPEGDQEALPVLQKPALQIQPLARTFRLFGNLGEAPGMGVIEIIVDGELVHRFEKDDNGGSVVLEGVLTPEEWEDLREDVEMGALVEVFGWVQSGDATSDNFYLELGAEQITEETDSE